MIKGWIRIEKNTFSLVLQVLTSVLCTVVVNYAENSAIIQFADPLLNSYGTINYLLLIWLSHLIIYSQLSVRSLCDMSGERLINQWYINCVYWRIAAICCRENKGQTSYKFHKTYDNIKSLKHLMKSVFFIISTGFNSSFMLVWRGDKLCMFFFMKCILFLIEIILKSLKLNWLSLYRNSVVFTLTHAFI